MRELNMSEIEAVSGGNVMGAIGELGLAGGAFLIGSTGIGLLALGAAAVCYMLP